MSLDYQKTTVKTTVMRGDLHPICNATTAKINGRIPRLTPTPAARSKPTQHQQTRIFSVLQYAVRGCFKNKRTVVRSTQCAPGAVRSTDKGVTLSHARRPPRGRAFTPDFHLWRLQLAAYCVLEVIDNSSGSFRNTTGDPATFALHREVNVSHFTGSQRKK